MSKEYLVDNDLVKVIESNSSINIVLIDDLTCVKWGNYWEDVRNVLFNSKIHKSINVNFENCLYADPVPMMSILLELLKLKDECNNVINIVIPSIFSNDIDNKNYKRGQFLKYLSTEGFLKIMFSNFNVKNQKMVLKEEVIEKYATYSYNLPYMGNVVVPIQTYQMLEGENTHELLDSILNVFMFSFKNKVGLHTYNSLKGYIYNIANELIENSINHAYNEHEKKRFALYIRNISGCCDSKSDSINGFNKQEISREKVNCPAIDTQIYMDNSAFLEIYFVDIGMGLTESLKDYYISQDKDYKYPVRELFRKVLKDGIRKNNSNSVTPFGGLHFICRIISENNGYIWCNEGREWIGTSSARLLNDDVNSTIVALSNSSCKNITGGLNWCFKIPYDDFDLQFKRNEFFYKWCGSPKSHPVYKAYSEKGDLLSVSQALCLDERRDRYLLMNGDYSKWKCQRTFELCDITKAMNTKILVWIPKSNYTKNQISRRLKDYFLYINGQLKNNKIDYVVISDIESNELISYFYAFNQNSTNVIGRETIKKLLLITNKWEVVCFDNVDGVLNRSKDNEEKLFLYSNSNEIYNNIGEYGRFVRIYDSYCFWQLIRGYESEKIYLNAEINWGNQKINGYLDLIRIHMYDDLYNIVRNSLIRISGLVDNSNVEYRNIDQTVERLCQDINSKLSIQNNFVTPIDVCGACVTGYTKESYYCDSEFALSVILFLHPMFDKELGEVAILFIWPNNEFFSDFEVDNDIYYRLGKTSFITSDLSENLIDLSTIYDSVVRNKEEMYEDFQMKVSQFIRYGHYKTDNHHYLIGFDFISYVKYSYMKKEGVFLYFLWKILYYLVGENVESVYPYLQDKSWEPVLKSYRNGKGKDSNHGEIVVYHSNTVTEYIMRLIKTIIPQSFVSRIIPVNIVELQEKGGPLAFSPFVMKKVKMEFLDRNSRGILYVDSSFSTGRRMLEIENVFLAAGCKKVSFLTIIDMRRLRNRDLKNCSYWKVNLPRLDDNGHCVICDAFKKINDYAKKTDSEIGERLLEWRKNWLCMSITNSISEHGIEQDENLSCSFDKVSIRNSTILNLYVAEKICESYNNDFVYTYITNKKTDLKPHMRLQLICTQILLFGDQHSRKLQLSLLSEIIGVLSKTNEETVYTSLAGIVLISQKSEVIYELLNEILYLNQVPKIRHIKENMLLSENKDLVIAIGYFLKNNYLIEELLNSFPEKSTSKFINMVNEHMIPDKNLKLLFKDFEGLYINEMGRRHNTNRQKLLSEHSVDYESFVTRCNQVINDMIELAELSTHFPMALVNSKRIAEQRKHNINELIANLKLEISNQQKEYKSQKYYQGITQFVANEGIKTAVGECERFFDRIIDSYYISYDEDSRKYLENQVKQYILKYGKGIDVDIRCEGIKQDSHKYYYWNASIEKEFLYMLDNVVHCSTLVDEYNFMKVELIFQPNKLLIKFISWSEKIAEQVKHVFLTKNRLSKEQSIAFDVIFEFSHSRINEDSGEFLLESTMSIPACFPQLKGVI